MGELQISGCRTAIDPKQARRLLIKGCRKPEGCFDDVQCVTKHVQKSNSYEFIQWFLADSYQWYPLINGFQKSNVLLKNFGLDQAGEPQPIATPVAPTTGIVSDWPNVIASKWEWAFFGSWRWACHGLPFDSCSKVRKRIIEYNWIINFTTVTII